MGIGRLLSDDFRVKRGGEGPQRMVEKRKTGCKEEQKEDDDDGRNKMRWQCNAIICTYIY